MPEWRSTRDHIRRAVDAEGNAISTEWTRTHRELRFNIDRTTLVLFGLVIAEAAR